MIEPFQILQVLGWTLVATEVWAYGNSIGRWLLQLFSRLLPEEARSDYVEEVESYIDAAAADGRRLTALMHGLSTGRLLITGGSIPRLARDVRLQVFSVRNVPDEPPRPTIAWLAANFHAAMFVLVWIIGPIVGLLLGRDVAISTMIFLLFVGPTITCAGLVIWVVSYLVWLLRRLATRGKTTIRNVPQLGSRPRH